jgi:hypothetical protein
VSELAGLGIVQGGAAAVLGIVVLFILLGRLVPRRAVDDLREDYAARIAELITERDMWRTAHQVSEEARHEDQMQAREMLELSRASVHVLRSLPAPYEGVADAQMDEDLATQ